MWRRWSTPQNFFLKFIDELEKQLFIKKLLKWANKKHKNVVFLKKKKEKKLEISLFYSCVPKILMIWSTVPDVQSMINWNLQFCSFFTLPPPKSQKNQNFEPKIIIIWCMVPDIRSETDRIFCCSAPFFALLSP